MSRKLVLPAPAAKQSFHNDAATCVAMKAVPVLWTGTGL